MRATITPPYQRYLWRKVHGSVFDPDRSPDLDPAVDQDRRLSRKIAAIAASPRSIDTGLNAIKLMEVEAVLAEAAAAKARRRPRASAWARRGARRRTRISKPSARMVEGVKAMGMETCVTLGMLTAPQAQRLKRVGAGLLQSQSRHLAGILPPRSSRTRTYQDRLDTLEHVRERRHPCLLRRHCRHGREAAQDRVGMIACLGAACRDHPESVPINAPGADRRHAAGAVPASSTRIDFVRTIAVRAHHHAARPWCGCRPGAKSMNEETQAFVLLAGANSIFYGPKLLTTPNPVAEEDRALFDRLGFTPMRLASRPWPRHDPENLLSVANRGAWAPPSLAPMIMAF